MDRWGDFAPPRRLRPGRAAALDLAEGLVGHSVVALRIAQEAVVGLWSERPSRFWQREWFEKTMSP